MQEKKDGTKPVRIKTELLERIEQEAIKVSAERGQLLSISELTHELLEEALKNRGAKPDK